MSAWLIAVVGISVLKHAGLKPSGVEEAEWFGATPFFLDVECDLHRGGSVQH